METMMSGAKMAEHMAKMEAIQVEAKREVEEKLSPAVEVPELLSYVNECFTEAEQEKTARNVTQDLEESLRRRNGLYTDNEQQQFRSQGQPIVWCGLTETKCVNGEAWGNDIIDSVGNEYFTMAPSPRPDMMRETEDIVTQRLADEIEKAMQSGTPMDAKGIMSLRRKLILEEHDLTMAEVNEKTDALRRATLDVLTEIEFNDYKKAMLSDAITFGTGFIKGPIVYPSRKGEWRNEEYYINDEKVSIFVSNPHPMDMYPSPSSCKIQDGYVIERVRVGLSEAKKMLEAEGFIEDNVKLALEAPQASLTTLNGDTGRTILESKPVLPQPKENKFEYYEYWGTVQGSIIKPFIKGNKVEAETEDGKIEVEVESKVEDDKCYHVQVIFTKQYILKVMLNPLMTVPYRSASYKQRKGSIWGRSVPLLCKESQDILNGTVRALVKNVGVSSGPQTIIDPTQLDPKIDISDIIPFGMWITNGQQIPGVSRKPVEFFMPESRMGELMAVAKWCNELADNRCSIPAYTYGNDAVASVGQTSSGLSMMLNAAGRGMKDTLSSIDRACASSIKMISEWILMYPEVFGYGDEIKGDANVIVKGSMGVLLVELKQARMREMMALLMNPQLAKLVLPEGGWVKLLHQYAKMMDISLDGILPKEHEYLYQQDIAQENEKKMQLAKLLGEAGKGGGGQMSSLDTIGGLNANPDKTELMPPNTQGLGGGVEPQ